MPIRVQRIVPLFVKIVDASNSITRPTQQLEGVPRCQYRISRITPFCDGEKNVQYRARVLLVELGQRLRHVQVLINQLLARINYDLPIVHRVPDDAYLFNGERVGGSACIRRKHYQYANTDMPHDRPL